MTFKKLSRSISAFFVAAGIFASSGFGLGASYVNYVNVADAATLSEYRATLQKEREKEADPVVSSMAGTATQDDKEALKKQLADAKAEIERLSASKGKVDRDSLAILASRLDDLESTLREQAQAQDVLMDTLNGMSRSPYAYNTSYDSPYTYKAHSPSNATLVNPGPQGNVSYTQDAKNAQHNSTMVFSYAPDQLYKIYCRTGYLTDIELKKGERISFVGGGDTSSWAVNTSTVDGVPHIYVKPVVQSSTTNLIINTNKRSYQIILNTSNWYNPMVKWNYDLDDAQAAELQAAKDSQTIVADMSVTSFDNLHIGYDIKVKGNKKFKPDMVADDGEKTFIKSNQNVNRLPALFIKEEGKKDLSLANFKTNGNCYIIDRVIDRAELRYSDSDIVTIKRKK